MSNTRHIRVAIVDDHEMVRVGLSRLLSSFDDLKLVGCAESVASAIALILKEKPDVVLLDMRLPDGRGSEVAEKTAGRCPGTRFLALTSYADDREVLRAFAAGVKGYLLKNVAAPEMVNSIRKVHAGLSVIAPEVTHVVLDRVREGTSGTAESRISLLSAQEKRVLAQVVDGRTNKEIAATLGLSDKTVKNYLSNAMDKLGVRRRSEAAAVFVRGTEE